MTMAGTESEQAVCPGCNKNPVTDSQVQCAECEAEENAGREDGQTAAQAKQENFKEQQRPAPPAAEKKKRGAGKHPPAEQQELGARQPPANGTQEKAPPAQAKTPPAQAQTPPARPSGPPGDMPPGPPPGQPPRPAAGAGPRMGLASVITDAEEVAEKIVLYGPEGVGKTTFGMDADSPIFLAPELSSILKKSKTPRFPQPTSFGDVQAAVHELTVGQHKHKTLVIDTLDRVEEMAQMEAISQFNKTNPRKPANNIEEVGGGFKKGYVAAYDLLRGLIMQLERLVERRGMNIVLLAHGAVRKIKDPSLVDDFEQWDLKLYNGNDAACSDLFRNWVDTVLFVNYETRIKYDFRGKAQRRAESPSDGNRWLYTQRTAGWRAKNRDGLPLSLQFSWEHYTWAKANCQNPAYLIDLITEKATEVGDESIMKWVTEELAKKPDVRRLVKINLKLAARLEKMVVEAEAAVAGAGGAQ